MCSLQRCEGVLVNLVVLALSHHVLVGRLRCHEGDSSGRLLSRGQQDAVRNIGRSVGSLR